MENLVAWAMNGIGGARTEPTKNAKQRGPTTKLLVINLKLGTAASVRLEHGNKSAEITPDAMRAAVAHLVTRQTSRHVKLWQRQRAMASSNMMPLANVVTHTPLHLLARQRTRQAIHGNCTRLDHQRSGTSAQIGLDHA